MGWCESSVWEGGVRVCCTRSCVSWRLFSGLPAAGHATQTPQTHVYDMAEFVYLCLYYDVIYIPSFGTTQYIDTTNCIVKTCLILLL